MVACVTLSEVQGGSERGLGFGGNGRILLGRCLYGSTFR